MDVDYKEYGLKMLKAGASLKGKTKEEIRKQREEMQVEGGFRKFHE